MSLRLIHIAPELPPTVGGVADYTAILSRRLVEVSDGAVEPVLVHAGNQSAEAIEVGFPSVDLSGACSASALAETVEQLAQETEVSAVVLLEYSGYGYAKRGAPLWLARGLRRVCGPDGVPLITMFHELYATGPPWTSAFWMSFPQSSVARQLASCSTEILTNRISSKRWLESVGDGTTMVKMQPVFSNVGEPKAIPLFESRKDVAILFGGVGTKRRIYRQERRRVKNRLEEIGIDQVVDIGPRPEKAGTNAFGVPVLQRGILPAEKVSELLKRGKVGLVQCPSDCITKSGVAASYFAHGVVPLVVGKVDASLSDRQYLTLDRSGGDDLAERSRTGREWYCASAHSRKCAQHVMKLLSRNV